MSVLWLRGEDKGGENRLMKRRPMTWRGWGGLILLCLASPVWSEAQKLGEPVAGLQAVLDIPDSTVVQGEYLGIDLELRNVSNTPFSLYRDVSRIRGFPGEVRFLVQRADGIPIKISELTVERARLSSPEDYVRLQPSASLKRSLEMYPAYDDDKAENLSDRFKMLEPGQYGLRLEISFTDEGKRTGTKDAWVGTVFSNPMTFEVIPGPTES